MNTDELQKAIGTKAKAYPTNAAMLDGLRSELAAGDAVIFMSSGSFSGTQHQLASDVRLRQG